MTDRSALIILGMHRSGTSALGGVLARLGVQTPASLMQGDVDNPKGYYESAALTDFNDRLLATAGGSWEDWTAWDASWLDSEAGAQCREELRDLLIKDYGETEFFLVKDPRICRLLPLWIPVLRELGVQPRVIIPLRDPREVAASLSSRSRLTVPTTNAKLSWLRHVLDSVAGTSEVPRVFTRYEDLLEDWRAQVDTIAVGLGVSWPAPPEGVIEAVETFLEPGLRHHRMAVSPQATPDPVDAWAGRAYAAATVLVEEPGNADALTELAGLRTVFDEFTETIGTTVAELRRAGEDRMRSAVAAHQAEVNSLRAELTRLSHESDQRQEEINRQGEAFQRVHESLDESNQRVESLTETIRIMAATERKLRQEHADLESDMRDRILELAELTRRQLSVNRDAELINRALQEEVEALSGLVRSRRAALRRLLRRPAGSGSPAATLEEERALIRASALFNPGWYLRQYDDVGTAGAAPAIHYLTQGAGEGRDPGPTFSTQTYLDRYPDVAASGVNPLVHYLRIGRYQGRSFL